MHRSTSANRAHRSGAGSSSVVYCSFSGTTSNPHLESWPECLHPAESQVAGRELAAIPRLTIGIHVGADTVQQAIAQVLGDGMQLVGSVPTDIRQARSGPQVVTCD